MRAHRPTVGLFVTCLVDTVRPAVGFAAVKLLERAGCDVVVPAAQSCCGQPAYNSGDRADATTIARQVIAAFAKVDYVVIPSGSCAGTIKVHYPEMFADEPQMAAGGRASRRAHLGADLLPRAGDERRCHRGRTTGGVATYHDSCSGLRELGVKAQPRGAAHRHRRADRQGAEARPRRAAASAGCSASSIPEISEKMVDTKVDDVLSTGADTLIGGDLGCLLNIAGRLHRRGEKVAGSSRRRGARRND